MKLFHKRSVSGSVALLIIIIIGVSWAGLLIGHRSYERVMVSMGGDLFVARVADTEYKRNRGLSGTKTLAPDEAMIFLFSEPSRTAFWMVGMKYPIDIVWIRDGRIIDIAARVPPIVEKDESKIPRYYPRDRADWVVEVSAGTVDRLGIKLGDVVKITESR